MKSYKLRDVVDIISEREENPSNSIYAKFVGLEHYISGDVEITKYGNTELLKSAMKVFKAGDILVARRNVYLRRAAIVNFDGITSGDSIVLRAKNKQMQNLLPFVLNTDLFWSFAEKHSDGTMSKRLSPTVLLSYEFSLPPIEKQEELTALLWAANDVKKAYKGLIDLTDEVVKAKFIEMFGDPITNPLGWPTIKIEDFCYVTKLAGFEYTKHIHYQDKGNVIMVKGLNVKEKHLKLQNVSYIDATISDALPRSQLHEGDVVMTYIGINIGDVAIIDELNRYHLAPNVAKISPLDLSQLNSVFLVNLLYYSRSSFVNEATITAKPALNMDRIRKIKTFLPPKELQDDFEVFIKHTDKSKIKLEQTIVDIENIMKPCLTQYAGQK